MVKSTVWDDELTPAADYYRPFEQPLPSIERVALDSCSGRILDVGAGAGRHALELQNRGHDVLALDICPDAVEVMRERGVKGARCLDFFDFTALEKPFDTILLLMHGIGFVGTLDGLATFFRHARALLASSGQILCDSADIEVAVGEDYLENVAHSSPYEYPGSVVFEMEFGTLSGKPYPWLFVDPETLEFFARESGFTFEILATGTRGTFLARLSR